MRGTLDLTLHCHHRHESALRRAATCLILMLLFSLTEERSLCTLYLSHASWSYRRRLGRVSVVVGLRWMCDIQLFERNYFPLFVDSS